MSEIFDKHTSIIYEAKGKNKTAPFKDQRLVVTIAKADKDGNYGEHLQQTMATSIPVMGAYSVGNSALQGHIVLMLQDVQNDIISERVRDGKKTHTDSDLDEKAIVAFLDKKAPGNGWTVERVADWFDSVLAEPIGLVILEKRPEGTDEELEQLLANNRKAFSEALGSRKPIRMEAARVYLARLNLIDPSAWDGAARRFAARLNEVLVPTKVALEQNLGF